MASSKKVGPPLLGTLNIRGRLTIVPPHKLEK